MATASKSSFYVECVNHICRLEQRLESLKGLKAQKGPTAGKLDEINRILLEIAEFVDAQDSVSLPPVANDVAEMHEKTKKIQQLLAGRSWDAVKRMFGGIDGKAFELKIEYADLEVIFRKFVVEHFVNCVKKFDAPASDKQAYLESVDAFSADLAEIW